MMLRQDTENTTTRLPTGHAYRPRLSHQDLAQCHTDLGTLQLKLVVTWSHRQDIRIGLFGKERREHGR